MEKSPWMTAGKRSRTYSMNFKDLEVRLRETTAVQLEEQARYRGRD
jgi:hypothetical protein